MTGRHRKSTPSTGLQLSRVGALAVLAAAPLVTVGTASASPGAGSALTPERRTHDHSPGSDDSYESSGARHRARSSHRRSLDLGTDTYDAKPVTTTRRSSPTRTGSTQPTDAQWDRVAECESSRNWSANTGNGYKGGLQFSDSTWRAYGGNAYAPTADKASREEQIAVAKQVQRDRGSSAWPSCGSRLGGT